MRDLVRQCVILVGGKGTRLRSLGFSCPKPMIEIAGRPFLDHVIAQFSYFGVSEFLLLAGHLGEQVRDRYDGMTLHGARVKVLIEPMPLGTGGALKFAREHLHERFVMANGDSILLCDLSTFVSNPLEGNARGRLLLREVPDAARYASVRVRDNGIVQSFQEKKSAVVGPGLISAGVYLLNRDAVLNAIGEGERSIERDVFSDWASQGVLEAAVGDGYFIDIGVPDSYEEARRNFARAIERPAAFLDRDGVINVDHGYTHRIEDLEFTPTAVKAIKRLNGSGYFVVVVSNQAGVAHGRFTEADISTFHREMQRRLLMLGAHIDAFYYCPYHVNGIVSDFACDHEDRKPNPGMILRAMTNLPIRKRGSFLIGDKEGDVQAANRAGLPGYLVKPNVGDLAAIVETSLAEHKET